MYWKGHEKMCTLQCRRGIVNRRSQFNEIDKRDRYKRVPGMFRSAHEVRLNMKGAEQVALTLCRHCSPPDSASKAQAEVQTHRSENLLSHLHLSSYTWSDGRKLPDTDQFVSSEAFMIKGQNLLHDGRAGFCPRLKCQWKEVRQCKESIYKEGPLFLLLCKTATKIV